MIAIPLLLIAALYVALLIWMGRKLKTWFARSVGLLLLLSPVLYMTGSYQYVQYRHKQDCASEGGLKVFIKPERVDRIRLDSESYSESTAKYLLDHYSPNLVSVEAWDREYTGKGQKSGYFSYSVDLTTTELPKKDWKFKKMPLNQPAADLYVLSESTRIEGDRDTTTWKLSRNGLVYASWTMFYHYWSRNSAMNIGWQCFKAGSPEGAGLYPDRALTELILK